MQTGPDQQTMTYIYLLFFGPRAHACDIDIAVTISVEKQVDQPIGKVTKLLLETPSGDERLCTLPPVKPKGGEVYLYCPGSNATSVGKWKLTLSVKFT